MPGPQGAEDPSRRQNWILPSPQSGVTMRATLFRPPGPGPFPLVVINHGTTQSAEERAKYRTTQFAAASNFFLQHGYAVLVPQRPGHGETGGPYLEPDGPCASADYRRSGLATAASISAAIDYIAAQSFISRSPAIVVGQSAGGWGALALASRNPRNIKAVINFAGGRGGRVNGRPNNNCAPERLVATAGEFGATTRVPTLWIYTENDSFFSPELSGRMAEAYRRASGPIEYRLLPAFGVDGHRFFDSKDAVAIWGPIVEKFLKELL
jgi:dienelactone hydrolase